MKIGIIQTQRLGDVIIVLPAAQWFVNQGHQVYWPVRADLVDAMAAAAPDIAFLPVDPALEHSDPVRFFLYQPIELLQQAGCEKVYSSYLHLDGEGLLDPKLMNSLKFDEYKYARMGVPFVEKWNLHLQRDSRREQALYKSLGITGEYILVHNNASIYTIDLTLPEGWAARYQIIHIKPLTDNPFDWIYTIEHAAKLVMIDSSFANLTEQLNIGGEKYLVVRSPILQTPVYRNGWIFCWPFDPIPDIKGGMKVGP